MNLEGLYDIAYFEDGEDVVIYTFERLKNRKKRIKKITNFYPYFYVLREEFEQKRDILTNFIQKIRKIERVNIKTIDNKEVVKIVLHNPKFVYDVRQNFENTYEDDILFVNRFVIDNVNNIEKTDFYKIYFDIEVSSKKGFPNFETPNQEILSISFYDNYKDKFFVFYHSNSDIFLENVEMRKFDNEKDMINSFFDYINQNKPDFLLAWNIVFDINYLVARAKILGIDINKLSPLYRIKENEELVKFVDGNISYNKFAIERDNKIVKIVGIKLFDLLQGYKHISGKELISYSLDYVAKEELGKGKTEETSNLDELYEKDLEGFLSYNLNDVELIVELDKKVGIFDKYSEIMRICYLTDINDTLSSGRVLDNYFLKKVKNKFVLPSKRTKKDIFEIGGAFVKKPKAGIYKNVAVFDFSSFYPSIIKTFNLSPDVFIKGEAYNLNVGKDEDDEFYLNEKIYDYENEIITYKIKTNKYEGSITINMNKNGFVVDILNELISLRKKVKEKMKQYEYGTKEYETLYKLQFSYKFLINAVYGVLIYKNFRLFNSHLGNTITAFARMINRFVATKIQQKGWNWIYSDTDSIFVELKTESLEDNLKEIEEIKELIQKTIEEFLELSLPSDLHYRNEIKMDCEKIYSKLLFVGEKKKYAGYLKWYDGQVVENKFNYMGLEFKKSNVSEIERWAQERIVKALLNNENIKDVIKEIYERVNNETSFKLFFIPSKLSKEIEEYKVQNIPLIRGIRWSKENLGLEFRKGNKFYLLYTNGDLRTDIIAVDNEKRLRDYSINIVNKKKYFELINRKLHIILKNLDYDKYNNEYYNIYSNSNMRLF